MRKLKKYETILLLAVIALLSVTHAIRNTSLTKQGFIRKFSRTYHNHIQPNPSENAFYTNLALVAEQRASLKIKYDGAYEKIPYPNGDIDKEKGVCTDVIVRSYRAFGVDLQELIHLDMKGNFIRYPKIWRKLVPDTNIDHRRVPNQMVFFRRKGVALPITDNPTNYKPGEIVVWSFGDGLMHVGIVSTQISNDTKTLLIAHNMGRGPEVSNILFSFPIIGHFRYMPSNQGLEFASMPVAGCRALIPSQLGHMAEVPLRGAAR